jgi:hypothetical protein
MQGRESQAGAKRPGRGDARGESIAHGCRSYNGYRSYSGYNGYWGHSGYAGYRVTKPTPKIAWDISPNTLSLGYFGYFGNRSNCYTPGNRPQRVPRWARPAPDQKGSSESSCGFGNL